MPRNQTMPLVGAHFRPPARALLSCLPAGAALRLLREPDNEYDTNAIKVIVETTSIPESQYTQLELLASGFGWSLEQILAQREWPLGYVAAKTGEAARLAPRLDNGEKFKSTLGFDSAGKPTINLEPLP